MRRFVRGFPFLTLGLITFGLFLASVGAREVVGGVAVVRGLEVVVRFVIIPMWLMRYLEMFVGLGRWPFIVQVFVDLPLLFTPYLVADLVLRKLTGWPDRVESS